MCPADIFSDFGPRVLHISFKNDENSKNVDFWRLSAFLEILSFLKAIWSTLGPKSEKMSGRLFFWKLPVFLPIWSAVCSIMRPENRKKQKQRSQNAAIRWRNGPKFQKVIDFEPCAAGAFFEPKAQNEVVCLSGEATILKPLQKSSGTNLPGNG